MGRGGLWRLQAGESPPLSLVRAGIPGSPGEQGQARVRKVGAVLGTHASMCARIPALGLLREAQCFKIEKFYINNPDVRLLL